jgi:nucleoside-diphosphate-sugar epimerase
LQNEKRAKWRQADLSDASAVRHLLTEVKPDIIFHLASHVAGARDLGLVLPTFHSNLMSTVNLLTISSELGCRRIVLTGSMEEPEAGDPQAIPSSPYAIAKWACSSYARMFHALYQTPVVVLRVFMVYGPAQKDLRKLIPYVILSLLRREAPQLTNGHREVDWIYVEDVVEAFLAAGRAPDIEGRTIDVGSGKLVPIRTVVENLVRMTNPEIEPLFGTIPDRPLEQVRMANIIDSETLLGWRPSTPLEAGLKRTMEWYALQLKEGKV